MKGTWCQVWHPDSPGTKLFVWRPWWKRKFKEFATLNEAIRASKFAKPQYATYIDILNLHQTNTAAKCHCKRYHLEGITCS